MFYGTHGVRFTHVGFLYWMFFQDVAAWSDEVFGVNHEVAGEKSAELLLVFCSCRAALPLISGRRQL